MEPWEVSLPSRKLSELLFGVQSKGRRLNVKRMLEAVARPAAQQEQLLARSSGVLRGKSA